MRIRSRATVGRKVDMVGFVKSLAATLVAMTGFFGSSSIAQANSSNEAPPHFDGLTMLRVAQGYNLTKAYDLSFPAKSDEACEIAGVGAQTFIALDHGAWANSPEGNALLQSAYDEAWAANPGDSSYVQCYWLRFGSASDFFSGLHRVWPATLRVNFKHLRRAMRKGDCKEAVKRLRKYPRVDIPRRRLLRRVQVASGGSCIKG